MKTKSWIYILFFLLLVPFIVSINISPGNYTTASAAPLHSIHTETVRHSSANLGGCQIFPDNNFWNTPVDKLPVHALSDAWINSIGAAGTFHMDFGSGTWDGGPIGIPYNVVSASHVNQYFFDFYYPDESDAGPYPLPTNPNQEWGSDHHILVIDTDTCTLYEIYDAWKTGGQWYGGSGAIWKLNSNALRPDTWTSADAAGLPIFPGLARYEEIAAGVIAHALRFTTNCTANYYIWPARHVARTGSCSTPVPFGARFRLKAGYDISGFSPQARVLLQAFKTYGIVLADNGSPWYVNGSPSEMWNNSVLHELDILMGSNFEAVDMSNLIVSPDSGEVSNAFNPWYGSVSITSNRNIVAVGRPHIGDEVASYDGFASGSLTAYVPMLFKTAWGSYDSALYIQDVSTDPANVTIKFYDSAGVLTCTKTDTISAISSKGYWLPSEPESCLPTGWVGGAIVTSTQPIVAVGRPHVGGQVMTYNGFTAGNMSMYLPMLFKNAYGSYDSAFYVQNVNTTNTANINIKYYDSAGSLLCTKSDTVAPLASKGYWAPSETCIPDGWVGDVVVTSDQDIVAIGRPHIGSQVTTYNGFAGGGSNMYVPMLFKNAYGGSYDSALYIQNVHASNPAAVTIKYYDSAGALNCTKTDTIEPLASKGYWIPSETCLPIGWVGGAIITSTQPIAAIGRPHLGTQVTTYNGFSGGSLNSFVPMLFKNMWGTYNSAFYVQNTDAANPAAVMVRFYDVNGNLSCARRDNIPALSTLGYWVPSVTCE